MPQAMLFYNSFMKRFRLPYVINRIPASRIMELVTLGDKKIHSRSRRNAVFLTLLQNGHR